MRWVKLLLVALVSAAATRLLAPGKWSLSRKRLSKTSAEGNVDSESESTFESLGSLTADTSHSSRVKVTDLSAETQMAILRKLLYSAGSKKKSVVISDRELVCNIRTWPLGWKVYHFVLQPKEKRRRVSIDFHSAYSKRKFLRILLSFEVLDKEIALTIKYASKGIPPSHVKYILGEIHDIFRENLQNQISMYRNRQKQLEDVSKAARKSSEAKKKKELDKIIHPEKYRKKASGNVRRSAGGNGRYRPSSEAQSRRVVRRS